MLKSTLVVIACILTVAILLGLSWNMSRLPRSQWELEQAPDMLENHLHVERFGPVHKTTNKADGTVIEEEYWEALISDDRNTHVYFVRCTPEEEARWRAFAKWEKEQRRAKLP